MLLAAAHGNKLAKQNALGLERLLTPEQITQGQKLAREFKSQRVPQPDDDGPTPDVVEPQP